MSGWLVKAKMARGFTAVQALSDPPGRSLFTVSLHMDHSVSYGMFDLVVLPRNPGVGSF